MSALTYAEWQTAAARLRPDLPPMWAEDLGLPLAQWDWEWLTEMYGDGAAHRHWFSRRAAGWAWTPDAPYAFWLGADT